MASKKKRRFGRVRKLPSGRWQARYPAPNGELLPAPETFERSADAESWLATMETDIIRGDWFDSTLGEVPLEPYAWDWIEQRQGLERSTVDLYRLLLRKHIAPYLGCHLLTDISTPRVRKWLKELVDDGRSEGTAAKAYRLLRVILNTALKEDGIIKSNPCCVAGAGADKTPERKVASLEQVFIAANAIQLRYRLLVLLATFASMRYAEMMGLWRDDFTLKVENGRRFWVVRIVRQAKQLDSGEIVHGPPKSEAGKRTVFLPALMTDDVQYHLDHFVGPEPDAPIFRGPKGAIPRRNNFHRIWHKARVVAGVPHLHLHDLRHTGNGFAAETGATLRELMARMGHSSTRAALIYLHEREGRGEVIAAGIDNIVMAATGVRGGVVAGTPRCEGARKGHDSPEEAERPSKQDGLQCSDQLVCCGAGDGNRTRMTSLED